VNITNIISNITDPIEPDSPAEKALNWLLNKDVETNACDGVLDIIERYVLALFYFSTNGNSWTTNTNWLVPIDHCSWYGVTCTNGPVDGIILEDNNLGGVLPKELSFLTSFNTLRIYQNNIKGEIPFEIYSLPLTFLDLELNQFTGDPFPTNGFEAMRFLTKLRISQNPFSQYNLPSYIGNMTRLEQLWIVNTNAIGTIPTEINEITPLEQFLARDNDFTGPIPAMDRLLNLDRILLQNNHFESSIPSSFGKLTSLRLFKLSNNNLTGPIPSSFSDLVKIEELELANNTMTGRLPNFSPLVSLRILDLSHNNFIGFIPDFSSSLKLNYTNLSFNSFSGTISASFFELPELKYLYLNNNVLNGPIPDNYGNSKSLIDLYLNNNTLNGIIPEIVSGGLPNLKELLINSNFLREPVPDSLCDDRTWISFHADCHPEEETGVPRNICPEGCCTSCFPIIPTTSYYDKPIENKEMSAVSNTVISSQPTSSPSSSTDTTTTGFFEKLKAWFMRLISVEEWTITEWIIFFIAVFAGVSILICLFNCFCCRDSKDAKKIERMKEKKRLQREKLREKHLEEYCEAIREKMREKNLEVEREMQIWANGERIANRRDLVDVQL
jgi:Leucine-rich repeat (LRR) protein